MALRRERPFWLPWLGGCTGWSVIPLTRKVEGPIPGQGLDLGLGSSPSWGAFERQPLFL